MGGETAAIATMRRLALLGAARLVALLAGVPLIGAVGLKLITGARFFDCLYLAVITITTVGYGEVLGDHLTDGARAFIMCYLVLGLGAFTFSVVQFGEQAYRAKLRDWVARRIMDTAIRGLEGHYIICGFGRMGKTVCQQLAAKKLPFVAVDRDEDALADARQMGWPWLMGDITDDKTLILAGIERARGLATVLPGDSDNLYVVLSARLLSKDLQIIARANDEGNVSKLHKAGANRVVGLHATGAARMTQLLVNPNVENFIGLFGGKGGELDLAEIQVTPEAAYAGKTLETTDFRKRGVIIVAIRKPDGQMLLPPPASAAIQVGDSLIAMGSADAIAAFIESTITSAA